MFDKITQWWNSLVQNANKLGVPVPTIRDPKSGLGSISLTLLFISFNVWLVSVIGKTAGYLGGMSTDECLNMFLACAGLYFGRKLSVDGTKKTLDDSTPSDSK